MKGEIILYERNEYETEDFQLSCSEYDFHIGILIDDTPNCLEQQLKNKKRFTECMMHDISLEYEDKKVASDIKKEWEYLDSIFDNLFDEIEYVKIGFYNENHIDEIELIEKNPIIQTKKIIINKIFESDDLEGLIEFGKKYNKYLDNMYVLLNENRKYISYHDALKTVTEIRNRIEELNQLNLSPMEAIMYTYDQVRSRVYKAEKEDEDARKSRDLTNVLFGEEIVCAGYAKLFNAILNGIGIKCHSAVIDSKTEDLGHERNIIYVKDPKYNIDGVYYFDTTWVSMRKKGDNSYLYSYKFFAKTRLEMEQMEQSEYEYRNFNDSLTDIYNELVAAISDEEYYKLYDYATSLNYMATIVKGESMVSKLALREDFPLYGQFNHRKFLDDVKNIVPKFNRPISAETYIRILNNVRKLEYYKDSSWYPYSLDYLYNVYKYSNWEMANVHYDGYEELLMGIFGKSSIRGKNSKRDFINFVDNEDIEREIEEVRLTKVLQKILEKKK